MIAVTGSPSGRACARTAFRMPTGVRTTISHRQHGREINVSLQRSITRSIATAPRSMGCWSIFSFEAHERAPREIVLDLDNTDGTQEGRFFHGYYDEYCYLPLYVFCGRHLLLARQRRANVAGSVGAGEEVAQRRAARWRGLADRASARGAAHRAKRHAAGRIEANTAASQAAVVQLKDLAGRIFPAGESA
jgi:hypothetical protein